MLTAGTEPPCGGASWARRPWRLHSSLECARCQPPLLADVAQRRRPQPLEALADVEPIVDVDEDEDEDVELGDAGEVS